MIRKTSLVALLSILSSYASIAQDLDYVKNVVKELSSEAMHGRGYVNKGDSIAAAYLSAQMADMKLLPFGSSYLQPYSFGINTFPGILSIRAGGTLLKPGQDYIINCSSVGLDKTFSVKRIGKKDVSSKRKLKKLSKLNLENTLLLLDDKGIEKKEHKENLQYIHQNNPFRAGAVFMLSDKTPIWSASDCRKPREYVRGTIVRSALPDAAFISIRFSSQFLPRYNTSNVAGYVMGSQQPDSFIVFMAHYDHLGRMGEETIYPGANDNASGTATVLDLARHYSSLPEPPPYSIAFLLFSGEEAGLLGSFHFAENPLFPLSSIRFAVNLDMVGTGSEGLRAVNGSIHTEEFNILKTLNDECSCLPEVGGRGESANSDHYPFHAKGVKTFFIFTFGKEHRHYHVPADVIETLPFTGYNSLFKLLTGFADKLQHHE